MRGCFRSFVDGKLLSGAGCHVALPTSRAAGTSRTSLALRTLPPKVRAVLPRIRAAIGRAFSFPHSCSALFGCCFSSEPETHRAPCPARAPPPRTKKKKSDDAPHARLERTVCCLAPRSTRQTLLLLRPKAKRLICLRPRVVAASLPPRSRSSLRRRLHRPSTRWPLRSLAVPRASSSSC